MCQSTGRKLTFQYWKAQNFQPHYASSCYIYATVITVQKTGTVCKLGDSSSFTDDVSFALFSNDKQTQHDLLNKTRMYTQTFVKVIFPLVILSSAMKIVGNVTGYCHGEHKRCTDPERTYSHSTEHTHNFTGCLQGKPGIILHWSLFTKLSILLGQAKTLHIGLVLHKIPATLNRHSHCLVPSLSIITHHWTQSASYNMYKPTADPRLFCQWVAINCVVLPTANAGQYVSLNCKLLLIWFPLGTCEASRFYFNSNRPFLFNSKVMGWLKSSRNSRACPLRSS